MIRKRRTIAVVTGTRAEFGLLRPVMHAIQSHPMLELQVIAAGSHLLPPEKTVRAVQNEFSIAQIVPMQRVDQIGRLADAEALARGVAGFARAFADLAPDVVLILGDRIEAFAAAAAASVGGVRVAHMHGGDRAEGVADEAMRHAITKLAHIHLPATQNSALRVIAMGEDQHRVHIVGSPAMDGLDEIPALTQAEFAELGSPQIVMLLHPTGDDETIEFERASKLLSIAQGIAVTVVLHSNHDPGRNGIIRAIEELGAMPDAEDAELASCTVSAPSLEVAQRIVTCAHLPREKFIGLLRRAKVIVGNSSAGLIECAAIPIRAVNIGRRQAGRETCANVTSIPSWDYQTIRDALAQALAAPPLCCDRIKHPYGDGRTGHRVAELLATYEDATHSLAKRNVY